MIGLITLLFPLLKDILGRVLPNPQEKLDMEKALAQIEARAREAEANAEAARAAEFAAFIAATQPSADRVYVWINSAIALVRPTMAVAAFIAPWLWPDRWQALLHAISANAPYSVVALVPVWAWVLGRDGLRMVVGAIAAFRSGTVPPGAFGPGIPNSDFVPFPSPEKPPVRPPTKPSVPPPAPPSAPVAPAPIWVPPPLPPVEGDNRLNG